MGFSIEICVYGCFSNKLLAVLNSCCSIIIITYCISTYVNCKSDATPVSKQDEENDILPYIFAILGVYVNDIHELL